VGHKRALVLAGGASFGAFQAGVVHELASQGVRWDAIYGTSVGAINGAYMAQGTSEEVVARTAGLCQFWRTVRTPDVYKLTWRSAKDAAVFWRPVSRTPGFFDTGPLSHIVYENIGPKPAMPLRVFATPALGGPLVVADERMDDIRPWVLASASIPILFPPVSIDGILYMDGGVRQNNPMAYALREGASRVDVVLCFPATGAARKSDKVPLISVAYRTLRAATDQFLEGEALALQEAHPDVVHVYRPDALYPTSPMEFNPRHADRMIEMGREAAEQD